MTAILAVTLAAKDVDAAGAAILVAIIPALVEIERVSLSPGDNRLLFVLRRLPTLMDQQHSVDDLYEALPKEVRSDVNRYDFADFVERLRRVGLAEVDDDGSSVRVRTPRASAFLASSGAEPRRLSVFARYQTA